MLVFFIHFPIHIFSASLLYASIFHWVKNILITFFCFVFLCSFSQCFSGLPARRVSMRAESLRTAAKGRKIPLIYSTLWNFFVRFFLVTHSQWEEKNCSFKSSEDFEFHNKYEKWLFSFSKIFHNSMLCNVCVSVLCVCFVGKYHHFTRIKGNHYYLIHFHLLNILCFIY